MDKKEELGVEFIDDDGTTLKGFSQVDLDKLNVRIRKNNILLKENAKQIRHLKYLTFFLFVIGLGFLFYVLWVTWYVISYDIFNNTLRVLGGL